MVTSGSKGRTHLCPANSIFMKTSNHLFKTGCALLMGTMLLMACGSTRKATLAGKNIFYEVGHRGTRGLMPENTIPAFEKGIAVGANTIEFDVHITKDNKVVVYHDNSFTPSYTTKPDGSDISNAERKKYTFYQMNYADIRPFIIGEKAYPAYPEQQRLKSYAPLMTEMIDSIEAFTRANHYDPAIYLLEIKSNPNTDGFEQPDPQTFMKIMMGVLAPYLKTLKGRLIIQSFDMRPLQVLHQTHPDIPLGFLTGDKSKTVEENLRAMGFVPDFYNPHFSLVNSDFLKTCHDKDMKVLPWTVDKTAEMQTLVDLGVDGIITDYPDRLETVVQSK